MAVAGRFVLQSGKEMNEFSQRLENESTECFVFSMKPTRIVVKLDYLKLAIGSCFSVRLSSFI